MNSVRRLAERTFLAGQENLARRPFEPVDFAPVRVWRVAMPFWSATTTTSLGRALKWLADGCIPRLQDLRRQRKTVSGEVADPQGNV